MENDTFLISAHHHKTFTTYGHAEVNTTKEQFLWLKIYIEKVPPQMQPQRSNVFVTWTGKEMVSGQISRQMALAWNKAGIFDERGVTKNVTGTTSGKSTCTGIRNNETGNYQHVFGLMTHSSANCK